MGSVGYWLLPVCAGIKLPDSFWQTGYSADFEGGRFVTMLQRKLSFWLSTFLCLALLSHVVLASEETPSHEDAAQTLSQWIENLPSVQQGAARRILDDVRPRARELRRSIEEKMKELEQFSYSRGTEPNTLPQLGRELQDLRDALMCLIRKTRQRMRDEAGITMEMPRTRSYGRVLARPAPNAAPETSQQP